VRKRWHAVIDRVPADRPVIGAEVGVLTGKLSAPLLAARPLLTLYLIDSWAPPAPGSSYLTTPDDHATKSAADHERDYRRALAATAPYADRRRVRRMLSVEAAAELRRNMGGARRFGFAFLDADHSRAGLAADIDAWLPLIRPGGWIGGHDHDHPLFPGVAEAVEAAFGGRVELDADRTWFVSLP
jgi:hypothetical protein